MRTQRLMRKIRSAGRFYIHPEYQHKETARKIVSFAHVSMRNRPLSERRTAPCGVSAASGGSVLMENTCLKISHPLPGESAPHLRCFCRLSAEVSLGKVPA